MKGVSIWTQEPVQVCVHIGFIKLIASGFHFSYLLEKIMKKRVCNV